jgi:type II secretory ATPase GspE/PulE/Tfp pilus assembly ATPase PilB-like protein
MQEPIPGKGTRRRQELEQREKLGAYLVRNGKLRADQLEHALKVHEQSGGLIGSVLMQLGMISDADLVQALSATLGLELLDLSNTSILQPDAVHAIPENVARGYLVLGVRFEQEAPDKAARIVVATSDPSDYMAVDSVRATTNLEPILALATRNQIRDALKSAYQDSPLTMDEAVGELKEFEVEVAKEPSEEDDDKLLRSEASLAPVVRYVNSMLYEAARLNASDIHIEPQEHAVRVRFRIDGELRVVSPPPKHMQNAITSRIKIVSALDISERRLPQDGRLQIRYLGRVIDMRISTMPTVFGEKVVMRLLDQGATELDLEMLGFEADTVKQMRRIIASPHGIVLLCGPTGCGKSTTLYSFIRELNRDNVNIVTVEDPVEYRLAGINQTHVKASIGLTFANCLRTIVRQDPDVIMIGEMRDLETLEVGVRASLTGHLVFSTLHTNTAVSSVTRMVNMGLEAYLISSTLIAALSQRLVRKVCKHCGEEIELTTTARRAVEHYLRQPVDYKVKKAVGCEKCSFTGYKGRLAVNELFEPDEDMREMITNGVAERLIEAKAKERGMQDLIENAWVKLRSGVTTVEEIMGLGFHTADDATEIARQQRADGDSRKRAEYPDEDFPETDNKGNFIDLPEHP